MPMPDPSPLDPGKPSQPSSGWSSRLRLITVQAAVALRVIGGPAAGARQIMSRSFDPLGVSTSYVILRNGIGVIGFALPIVLVVGGGLDHVQGSLSAYYHFSPGRPGEYGAGPMRDEFVGMLCAIGAFLFFYRGHSIQEDVALNVAGIAAVLVALFPMDWPPDATAAMSMAAKVHSWSAAAFFVTIAYVCVFRSRDTLCMLDDSRRRRAFERIYLLFGILMVATPATVALLHMSEGLRTGYKTLVVETAGVFVFAAFWLVKSWEVRSSLRRAVAA